MGLIYYGIGILSARSDACGIWGAAPHAFGWSPGGVLACEHGKSVTALREHR